MPYRLSLDNKILRSTQSNAVLRSMMVQLQLSYDQTILEYHQKNLIERVRCLQQIETKLR